MALDASIIITAYNVERYIERAVDSALKQTGVNVEVIIVDDDSTDGTWGIVQGLSDPRIRPFRLDRNSGPGAARNKGFAEAKGEWIVVLDGDDAITPTRLQTCIARAREANADIVVDNLLVCREADGVEHAMFSPKPFAKLKRLTLPVFIDGKVASMDKHSLGYLKPIFATSFLNAHPLRYRTDLSIGEDYIMLAEALALGAHCVIEPTAGYRYTVRSGSISHRLSVTNIERMQAADAEFVAKYTLDDAAQKAQRRRDFVLKELKAYGQLVEALKAKSYADVMTAIKACPSAVRHLWEPVWKRLRRVAT